MAFDFNIIFKINYHSLFVIIKFLQSFNSTYATDNRAIIWANWCLICCTAFAIVPIPSAERSVWLFDKTEWF